MVRHTRVAQIIFSNVDEYSRLQSTLSSAFRLTLGYIDRKMDGCADLLGEDGALIFSLA
jgi:hypothetical protein